MSDKITKLPQIRFAGFTDAWEQRKLGEFGKATGGTSIESEFIDGGKYKVISIGSYSETSIYTDQGIRADKTNKTESRILNKDDLTIILNDKTASGNIIGRVLLIDADNTYVYNQRTERIEVNKNEYVPQFLYQLLNADNIRSKIIRAAQGNTQIYVNWSAISELQYYIPLSKCEQKQIGAFFDIFDNLITLHQRKLELLKGAKKSLLEKMFPKGGANVPEIRFARFTDAWEQRRLNEYLTTSKVKNKDERFGKEDVLSVSGDFGIVNQIEFQGRSFAGVSVAPYGVVETGDVVYTKSPLKSNPFGIIKTNKGQAGIVSTLYAVYKPNDNVDSKFVERYFENDQRLNRYLKPLVNKGAKNDMKVSDDNALIGTVVFPVKVDEQRKISSFFNQLDNLITLHQRELISLKNLKKSLLQQMFV